MTKCTKIKELYYGEQNVIYCKLYRCLHCKYDIAWDDEVHYCPKCGRRIIGKEELL